MIGPLKDGGYIPIEVSPGEHTLKVDLDFIGGGPKPLFLKINVQPNQTYYVRFVSGRDSFVAIPLGQAGAFMSAHDEYQVTIVSKDLAESEISSTNRSQ